MSYIGLFAGEHERGPDQDDGEERDEPTEGRRPDDPEVRKTRRKRISALHLDQGQVAASTAEAAQELDEQRRKFSLGRNVVRGRRVGQKSGAGGCRLGCKNR